ncbi:hypothetical protein BDV11DRAFT_175637 [Aspergillus similis]
MIHQRDKQGYTPFHITAEQCQVELLDSSVSRALTTQAGSQRQHLKDTLGVFDAFAARGLDLRARTGGGETSLFKYIGSFSCDFGIYKNQSVIEGFVKEVLM